MLRRFDSFLPRPHLARLGLALSLLCGCSPTYQSLYEGDVRFEHCYRVDEERQAPITDKLQCWRDWTRHYGHGQSRDRVGYALARERTLAQALAAGEQAAPHRAAGPSQRTLPQPTDALAPSPRTMTAASAAAEAGANGEPTSTGRPRSTGGAAAIGVGSAAAPETSVPLVDAPGATCAGACGKTWTSCRQSCKAIACRSTCDEGYRGCMRACF
ncbi:MAG TPA: hypothetical protein VK540_20090 [Polyangiaceae bacterium]|nr:hypothetical protein [Polyangiaceae bacterium]